VSNCIWFLVISNSKSNSDAGNCNIRSRRQITITRPGSVICKKMECLMTLYQVELNVKWYEMQHTFGQTDMMRYPDNVGSRFPWGSGTYLTN
jgi:hypothetical protein